MWKKISRWSLSVVGSVMLMGPALSARADEQPGAEGQNVSAPVKDDWITSQLKQKLSTSVAGASTVDVDTKDDVVKLSGSVSSETTRIEAVQAARAIPGVKQVKDEIKVNPAK